MKVKRILSLVFVALFISLTLTGCSAPKHAIVGDWMWDGGTEISITFQNDGTYIWEEEDTNGTYTILSDQTLHMTDAISNEIGSFSWTDETDDVEYDCWHIDGDTLNLGGDIYIRSK